MPLIERCPFCGHPMADHLVLAANYDRAEDEVSCCNEDINPRTLTTCGCWRPARDWPTEVLTGADQAHRVRH